MPDAPTPPLRKSMRRWEAAGAVRFVTFSCQRRLPLLGNPAIRDLFAQTLAAARTRHSFELFAWVVMPEHIHLLLRPHPDSRLDEALRSIKTSIAKRVITRWHQLHAPILEQIRTGRGTLRFWQKGGGFDRNVRDEHEFRREVRYIHRNPVKRGLVARPEDWMWSSVRWWMGQRDHEVECDPPPGPAAAWAAWRAFV